MKGYKADPARNQSVRQQYYVVQSRTYLVVVCRGDKADPTASKAKYGGSTMPVDMDGGDGQGASPALSAKGDVPSFPPRLWIRFSG